MCPMQGMVPLDLICDGLLQQKRGLGHSLGAGKDHSRPSQHMKVSCRQYRKQELPVRSTRLASKKLCAWTYFAERLGRALYEILLRSTECSSTPELWNYPFSERPPTYNCSLNSFSQ